jgi:hypothetical protein
VKYATAHDLRRSFGTRWAKRVMPMVLVEMMRHDSIETTKRYYVSTDAMETADMLWDMPEAGFGNKTGDTTPRNTNGAASRSAPTRYLRRTYVKRRR